MPIPDLHRLVAMSRVLAPYGEALRTLETTLFILQRIHRMFSYSSPIGSERGTTTRKRERGEICCKCRKLLDVPPWGLPLRERCCDACAPHRRVYATFFYRREGWYVQFLETDARTSVGRGRHFASDVKIREMIARTPTKLADQDREKLERDIDSGRGGLWLELSQEQYRKLWRG